MSIAELYPGSSADFDGEYYDSQTEAAWASYLRSHEVVFMHEPETYRLPDGQIYTPDFYLSEADAFIEVKNGNADNLAAYKISQLTYATGKQGFIVNGKPHYATVYVYTPEWTFKPSTGLYPPHDQRLTRGSSPLDKKKDIWIPDIESEQELLHFALNAAKQANEASTKIPTTLMEAEHTDKKRKMRLPENIIDLSSIPMPENSVFYFDAQY